MTESKLPLERVQRKRLIIFVTVLAVLGIAVLIHYAVLMLSPIHPAETAAGRYVA